MRIKELFIYTLLFILWFTFFSISLRAVMIPLSTEELVNDSEVVLIGEVTGLESHWDSRKAIIFTRAAVRVYRVVKGKEVESTVFVEYPGGEVGEMGMGASDQPKMGVGENVLLFLMSQKSLGHWYGNTYGVVGAAQGKYSIGEDGIARKGGFSIVDLEESEIAPNSFSRKRSQESSPVRAEDIIDNNIPVQLLVRKIHGDGEGVEEFEYDSMHNQHPSRTSSEMLISWPKYSSHGKWNGPGKVRIKVNNSGAPSYGMGAVLFGMNDWNNVHTSTFTWYYAGTTTSKTSARNGVNIIYFTYLSGNSLGYSNWWYKTSPREIIETDIKIDRNGLPGYPWNFRRLKSVVVHELGHSLGLNHVSNDSIMKVPIADSRLMLFPDDIRAISYLYPGVTRTVCRRMGSLDAGGKSDIIIRRHTDGNIRAFLVDGINQGDSEYLASPGKNWRIVGVADLNGDGNDDVISRHLDGRFKGFLMNGLTKLSVEVFVSKAPVWSVVGIADINGDTKNDIILRHKDGRTFAYLMDGLTVSNSGEFVTMSRAWDIRGFGNLDNLNGDDIIWRNNDGRVHVSLMNGLTVSDSGDIATPDTEWSIVGIGDLNGDSKADIVMRHSDGRIFAYLMDGKTITDSGVITSPVPGWFVVGIADFNGDGKDDIIARKYNGDVRVYLLDGLTVSNSGDIFYRAQSWKICGFGNYDAQNGDDIAIRHKDGRIYIYLMNGLTIINSGQIASPGMNWVIQ